MKNRFIHETATVHPMAHVGFASVGANCLVWQFASVIRGAVLGDGCKIASCAIVDGSVLGDRCIISHSAFIDPGMLIGNDVFIGPHTSLANDFWPLVDKTDWFDMADLISGGIVVTRIADGASVGANAVVMPGVTIGKQSMIAAGAVVTRDVPQCSLFRRDGMIVPIDPNRVKRMRYVEAQSCFT